MIIFIQHNAGAFKGKDKALNNNCYDFALSYNLGLFSEGVERSERHLV